MSLPIAAERRFSAHEGTLVRVSWAEQGRGMPGALTLQLSSDHEVEEYTLRVVPEIAAELVEFFQRTARGSLDLAPEAPRLLTVVASDPPCRPPPRWAEAAFMKT
jgi:hypothetical protein